MTRPEEIPPEVRNTVLAILRDDDKGNLGVLIARAITAAVAAEREACALAAGDGYTSGEYDDDEYISGRIGAQRDIRARSKP